ncbi:hypothetical protein H920_12718 [Fukomys damarensis]|uniref:Uncharacterized protein n=1 Tax=Fukomys damarensis TaxID=885580 RepID=A0A091D1B6_FUKDA|nr:hypothetical protein H920_12718 [Fukomys damarensis]
MGSSSSHASRSPTVLDSGPVYIARPVDSSLCKEGEAGKEGFLGAAGVLPPLGSPLAGAGPSWLAVLTLVRSVFGQKPGDPPDGQGGAARRL